MVILRIRKEGKQMKKFILYLMGYVIIVFGLAGSAFAYPIDGLVGEWSFSGNANDTSGNNNNGIVNGAILTKDRFGNENNAYKFDGLNDSVSIDYSDVSLFSFESFTVSLWFQTTRNDRQGLFQSTDGSQWGLIGYNMRLNNLNDLEGVYRAQYPSKNELHSSVNINSSWHNIVLVRDVDNQQGYLYFDGIQVAIGSDPDPNISVVPQSSFTLGHNYYFGLGDKYLDGKLDDVLIYNRALSNKEIQEIAEIPVPEPSTFFLLTIGLLGIFYIHQRRHNSLELKKLKPVTKTLSKL